MNFRVQVAKTAVTRVSEVNSRMQAIYSCKLYKASKRKDKIQAAITNPMNSELVTQLAEYLDEEYQNPMYTEGEGSSDSNDVSIDSKASASDSSSTSSSPSSSTSGGLGSFPASRLDFEPYSEEDDSELEIDDEPQSDLEMDGEVIDDSEVSEVADIEDTDDDVEIESSNNVEVDLTDEIRALLNDSDEASGVNRVLSKESELWVYYNDDVNLNNVMGPAIELVSKSGYNSLEFNRLARSANAIVFQVEEVTPVDIGGDSIE